MPRRLILAFAVVLAGGGSAFGDSETNTCAFPDADPASRAVLISVHSGTRVTATPGMQAADVAVQPEDGPVVLFLSSFSAVEWRLAVLREARLEGIFLTGAQGSKVLGVPVGTRIIRHEVKAPNVACQRAGLQPFRLAHSDHNRRDLQTARQTMSALLPGRPQEEVATNELTRFALGNRPWPGAASALIEAVAPELDPAHLHTGALGLFRLIFRGDVEITVSREMVKAWTVGARARLGAAAPDPGARPASGGRHSLDRLGTSGAIWVVKRPTLLAPSGLDDVFVIPPGVAPPKGDPGESIWLFLDGYGCAGKACPAPLRQAVPSISSEDRLSTPAPGRSDPTLADYTVLNGARAGDLDSYARQILMQRLRAP
jgi:hypothetical protein